MLKKLIFLLDEYMKEINQWRDLWLHGGQFKNVIFSEDKFHFSVKKSMNWESIQLLHDHIISKPLQHNDKIPWHQDSMFWPIDSSGCSSWTAMQDVPLEAGCLEVIDCSHKNGCQGPEDFMKEEKNDFSPTVEHISIPIQSGEVILLHSFTWHRSSMNTLLPNRAAHIALWMHPVTKWRPDLVGWHPVNKFVESKPGDYLRGKRFPYFGQVNYAKKLQQTHHQGTKKNKESDISMFDSSEMIGEQFSHILQKDGDIESLLSSEENRNIIIQKTMENKICHDKNLLSGVLRSLWIAHSQYKKNKSRNVFNSSYGNWWKIAGEKWSKKEL